MNVSLRLAGLFLVALLALGSRTAVASGGDPETITLDGVIEPGDRYDYVMRAFEVPENTERIEVAFEYDRSGRSELEVGLYDPERFRGTSRFSKTAFFVATHTATPSYYPGPLPSGTWKVSIGAPTVYEPTPYSVKIRLYRTNAAGGTGSGPRSEILQEGAGWYHGDFHSHTGHSDGYGCKSGDGARVPCQVHENADVAAGKGLDFIAVTDHNTTSHHNELVALQERYRDMLLLRGQEVTTFYGHANVYGTSYPVDFRAPEDSLFDDIAERVDGLGALLSLNHPGRATGDACTGCGWSMANTDYAAVDAIEIVNGTDIDGPTSGLAFWYERLNDGYRITGIGGSDDHGASEAVIGTPTTAVYAEALSEEALLDGVRRGRVFVKTRGPAGPAAMLSARLPDGSEHAMGSEVTAPAGSTVQLRVAVEGAAGDTVVVVKNGERTELLAGAGPVSGAASTMDATVEVGAGRDWYLVLLRDEEGTAVVTNPIYIIGQ